MLALLCGATLAAAQDGAAPPAHADPAPPIPQAQPVPQAQPAPEGRVSETLPVDAEGKERALVGLRPDEVLQSAKLGAGAGEDTPLPDAATVVAAIEHGTAFLLGSQNEDGSWGSWREPESEFWSNPYSHKSWILASTGLVVMTLLEQPAHEAALAAADKGLDYMLAQPAPARPSDWDVDNTWGAVYGLDALTTALPNVRYRGTPREAAMRAKCGEYIASLQAYQTPTGGWGYYDFDSLAKRPSWATSFETAAALVALAQARDLGLPLPDGMIEAAMKGLERARMANGAYAYSFDPVPTYNLEWIDNVKGSLSRIQSGNYALLRAGSTAVKREDILRGLDQLFEHHRFLDVARKKPVPHEAYYLNSGYFYFFGHFYAARLLDKLAPADRARYAARLAREVVKTQEADGSMWDYHFNTYGKAYGTAFGVMTLVRTMPER
ncbi:MAG TPA: hypothetical protein VK824_04490 [Planctomycetota bacterium]|nr:hypothetical protein [Planctomycetota bacterium]